MSEEHISIKSADEHLIYGTLHSLNQKSDKLIVFAHGLSHSHQHYLPLIAAPFFNNADFDFFAFSFYWRDKKARSLSQTSLKDQISDLKSVITHYQSSYEDIYLIGHSLGALTALISNIGTIKAQSYWDPAFDVSHFWQVTNGLTPVKGNELYQLNYGNTFLIHAELVEQINDYPDKTCVELAKLIKTPTQLIIPSQSIFDASPHSSPEAYLKALSGPSELIYIEKANHTFTLEGNAEKLFNKALKWFNAHQS